MRVVALVGDQPNQRALCNKLALQCDLVGVIRSGNQPQKPISASRKLRSLLARVPVRIFAREFTAAWAELQSRYADTFPTFPQAEGIGVPGINHPETLKFLNKMRPDIVVVSGTNMVGSKILEWAKNQTNGAMNLHTGISPYIRGGPNCTNWCLALGSYHLIGNTVMWIDQGVDSGDIVATEQTKLDGKETLLDLHWKVMEHGHDLLCRAISFAQEGIRLPRSPQNLESGKSFRNSDWTLSWARSALRNFSKDYAASVSTAAHNASSRNLQLVHLLKPRR